MTYATITLLHKLLEEHLDTLEDQLQDADLTLEDEIAENEAAAQEGDKEATEAIYNAVENKQTASAKLNEAMAAMKDFEKHDWK